MEEHMEMGGGVWIFALLILLLLGNGGGLFGGGTNAVQQADLQRAIDLNSIQQGQGRIESRVQEVGAEGISATKDAAYNSLSEIRDLQTAVTTGFANSEKCCCETNRNIDSVRYDMANLISASNANTTAQVQRVLDKMTADREAAQAQRINQLELQSMLCGIPRVSPYGYNMVPAMPGPVPYPIA